MIPTFWSPTTQSLRAGKGSEKMTLSDVTAILLAEGCNPKVLGQLFRTDGSVWLKFRAQSNIPDRTSQT